MHKLQKGHTRADFFRVVEECQRAGITLQPTFVPFTPWTTFENYLDLFENLRRLNLVEAVAPIQLAIRLLIPSGSRLLELPEVREMVGTFDAKTLVYPWKNPNPALDRLVEEAQEIVAASEKMKRTRAAAFQQLWRAANHAAGRKMEDLAMPILAARATVPYLDEPWYC